MSASNKQGLNIVIIYLVVWIAVLIMQIVMVLPYIDSQGIVVMTDAEQIRLVSVTNLALYLTLFLIFIYMLRSYFKDQFKFTKDNLHDFIKISILGVVTLFIAVFGASIIMELLGVTENSENQEVLNNLVTAAAFDKVALILFSVLLAPVVEELVFRRAVFGFLEKINTPLAIIVSGLSFGLIHVLSGDYLQLIVYGSLGLVLAYIYYYSKKNIFTVIVVHMVYNLIITIVMFTT